MPLQRLTRLEDTYNGMMVYVRRRELQENLKYFEDLFGPCLTSFLYDQ